MSADAPECPGCHREVECLFDHAPDCPIASPPPETPEQVTERLTSELSEQNERLLLRELMIDSLLVTLMGFELPVHRVERIFESLCSEVACDFPHLGSQTELASLAQGWHRRLRQLENEKVERRMAERRVVLEPAVVVKVAAKVAAFEWTDCPDCHGTTLSPGTFTMPCELCEGTGKVEI